MIFPKNAESKIYYNQRLNADRFFAVLFLFRFTLTKKAHQKTPG